MGGAELAGGLAGAVVAGGLWALYQRRLRHLTWSGALQQAALVAGLWVLFMILADYFWPGGR